MHYHIHSQHPCNCKFIPDVIIEHLAGAGIKSAITDLQTSRFIHKKRDKRELNDINEFFSTELAGEAKRLVYDSKNTRAQQHELVRSEGDGPTSDDVVNTVYDHAGSVRDYFEKTLNRKSIDDASMDLILNVHYATNYNNAFWDGDEMTFGDGDGEIACPRPNKIIVLNASEIGP